MTNLHQYTTQALVNVLPSSDRGRKASLCVILHLRRAIRLLFANKLTSSPPHWGGQNRRRLCPFPSSSHSYSRLWPRDAHSPLRHPPHPRSMPAITQGAGSLPPQPQWKYQNPRTKRGRSCWITARLVNVGGWRKTGSLSALPGESQGLCPGERWRNRRFIVSSMQGTVCSQFSV